ncbi:uncharacterized protein [Watersipora subatra]|uniref:uncharacterized protein n=1 Tax=Watersipora subatra TaxID=2589382 RepID=UPI00355BE60E
MELTMQHKKSLVAICIFMTVTVCFFLSVQPRQSLSNIGERIILHSLWQDSDLSTTARLLTRAEPLQTSRKIAVSLKKSDSNKTELSPKETDKFKVCQKLLKKKSNVSKSDYKKQVVAATPGSGSDFCRLSLVAITGFYSGSVYELLNMTDIHEQQKLPFYYKTHFPFVPSVGKVDDYINKKAEKAVIVIRDPFDAAFSEWIRQKSDTGNKILKYFNLENLAIQDWFWKPGTKLHTRDQILPEFNGYLEWYLKTWVTFHDYWLSKYSGEVKVMLYRTLANDLSKFVELVKFLGYDPYLSDARKERLNCMLTSPFTSSKKRPDSATIDNIKSITKELYKNQTEHVTALVKTQFRNKFNSELTLE